MLAGRAASLAQWLHRLFEASLVVKGLLAALETAAGLGLWLTTNRSLHALADWLTRTELSQDPGDPMAQWFLRQAQAFSIESQHFYAIYLLSHGALKLGMVIALALGAMWAYPAAMAMLSGFVAYQMYDWSRNGSVALLALSAFDLFMIWLVFREYRARRAAA